MLKDIRELKFDMISKMFLTTSVAMILTELVGIIAVFIDGIITSRFLGESAYAGVSLLNPFTSIILVVVGGLSAGTSVLCSRFVGEGKRRAANGVFNDAIIFCVLISLLFILCCIFCPDFLLQLCGVKLSKYPELKPIMYEYLNGYMPGIPAMIVVQIMGAVIVIDNGKKLLTISSVILCVTDIFLDLLNVFLFHGGVFGMGAATAISFIIQMMILGVHFVKDNKYFSFSFKCMKPIYLIEAFKFGSPAYIRRLSSTLRDILLNYMNIIFSVSAVAIIAKGIQSDIFKFLFCIPTGLGRTLMVMAGIYFGVEDFRTLKRVFLKSIQYGTIMTGVVGLIAVVVAPYIARIYTSDPQILSLAVFSIRWMAVALSFDYIITLLQHYYQATENLKLSAVLSFGERFFAPVTCAFVLGKIYGTKGVIASMAISHICMVTVLFAAICIKCKGIPGSVRDYMALPEQFGGDEANRMYSTISDMNGLKEQNRRTNEFCKEHDLSREAAAIISDFAETMTLILIDHAFREEYDCIDVEYMLYVEDGNVRIGMMFLGNYFDPVDFYRENIKKKKYSEMQDVDEYIEDMRFFRTLKVNNLIIDMRV